MKNTKRFLIMIGMCVALTGCGNTGSVKDAAGNAAEIQTEATIVAETTVAETTVDLPEKRWTDEEMKDVVSFLEDHFSYGHTFSGMDQSQAESYGAEISDYYEFVGRVTEDGAGYVLGFAKGEENPFEGNSQFWMDGTYVIAEVLEHEDGEIEEKILYSMERVDGINQSEDYEIIFLMPVDLEIPEEIHLAFRHQYSNGEFGRTYLMDVMERGVRLSEPESGAYMEVWRHEDGKRQREYVPLTEEEEARILGSDALILPEWYGGYGLNVYVSEDTFDKTGEGEGPITVEALKIAEERCRFVAMGQSEIKDLVKAEMKLRVYDGEETSVWKSMEITEQGILDELEKVFVNAEAGSEGKCPYRAVLTLTREDGKEIVLTLAMDSCDGFILGSCGSYYMGSKGKARVWEIFDELRIETGWPEMGY